MVKELSSILKRHKNEIFVVSNNKRNVINTFIKKNESEIKKNYEVLCDIKEYKEFNSLLNDLFYKECKIDINKYFDSNGNTIDFNTSCNLKRGTEDYDPPYGWMGFGLKVIDKFENNNWLNNKNEKSEWAISYHGIGYFYDSDHIKNAIEDIIKNGLKQGEKSEGIVLFPEVKLAENNCGSFEFKGKKYKAILMVKTLIRKIQKKE